MIVVALACEGALGAPARFLLERTMTDRLGHGFPWGTTCVNLLGSFALGLVAGLGEFRSLDHDIARVVAVGFLGAFTTFSTFAVESTRLAPGRRIAYVGISVIGGIGLAGAGLALASV